MSKLLHQLILKTKNGLFSASGKFQALFFRHFWGKTRSYICNQSVIQGGVNERNKVSYYSITPFRQGNPLPLSMEQIILSLHTIPMTKDLTSGPITKSLLLFALPMIMGNLLQQFYNIADTMIVGRFLGKNALAAVGSSFTLMTFLTSIILGLAMGSGVLFSMKFGEKDNRGLREASSSSFFIVLLTSIDFYCSYCCCLCFPRSIENPHEHSRRSMA